MKFLLVLSFFYCCLQACTTLPKLPATDLLLSPKYHNIRYQSELLGNEKFLNTVQIVGRANQATIDFTLPKIFNKALSIAADNQLIVSNISFHVYSQLEPIQVPYQDCRNESRSVSVPQTSCTGIGSNSSCITSFATHTQTQLVCETKIKTEYRDVLYQKVVADIYETETHQESH